MAFDIEGARKAGYADNEIADYLGSQNNFDVSGARKSGYKDEEIISHLSGIPDTKSGLLRRGMGDVAISALKGAISLPEAAVGIADIPTLGVAGKAVKKLGVDFKQSKEYLDTLLSLEQQQLNKEVQQAEGFLPTVGAMLERPSTIAHQVIESAPSMVGGGGIGRGLLKVAPKAGAVIGGAVGEGLISAGQNVEQARQESPTELLTPKQAAVGAASGALTGLIGILGGKLAKRLNIADAETLMSGGSLNAAVDNATLANKKNILRRIAESAFMEGTIEELPQSAQEQMAQNIAQGKDPGEGVGDAAASGWLTGTVTGAAGGVAGKIMQPKETPVQAELKTDPHEQAANDIIKSDPDLAAMAKEIDIPVGAPAATTTAPVAPTRAEQPSVAEPELVISDSKDIYLQQATDVATSFPAGTRIQDAEGNVGKVIGVALGRRKPITPMLRVAWENVENGKKPERVNPTEVRKVGEATEATATPPSPAVAETKTEIPQYTIAENKPKSAYATFIESGGKPENWEAYAAEQNAVSKKKREGEFFNKWEVGEKLRGNDIANILQSRGIVIPETIKKVLQHDDTEVSKTSVVGRGLPKGEARKIHKQVSELMNNNLSKTETPISTPEVEQAIESPANPLANYTVKMFSKDGMVVIDGGNVQKVEEEIAKGSTPVAVEPKAETEVALTPEQQEADYKQQAEEAGVTFNGMQETGLPNRPPIPLFTHPEMGTTFTLQPGEKVADAIKRKQEQEKTAGKMQKPQYTRSITPVIDSLKSKGINADFQLITPDNPIPPGILEHMQQTGIIGEDGTHDVQGAYYDGKVYLFPENISSDKEAMLVASHELFHDGWHRLFNTMPGELGVKYKGKSNSILDSIWKEHNQEVRDAVKTTNSQLDLSTRTDQRQAANEWLANQAYESQPKWYDKVVAMIRSFIRDVMGVDIKFEDAEIRQLIMDVGQTMREGTTTDANIPQYVRSTPPVNPNTWSSPESSKLSTFIYNMLDRQIDTRDVVKSIETFSRTSIPDYLNPDIKERAFTSKVAENVREYLDREFSPLLKSMVTQGVKLNEFQTYLHNRHAEEANNHIASINPAMPDAGSGISTADAQRYLASLPPRKRAIYANLAARVDRMLAENRSLMVSYNLESQSTVDTWAQKFSHYVPLFREMGDDRKEWPGIGAGFNITSSVSRARKGSTDLPVIDILANIAAQRERIIVQGEKNKISTALLGLAEAFPNPDFWKTIQTNRLGTYIAEGIEARVKENVVLARVPDPATGEIKHKGVQFNTHDPRAERMSKALKNLDMDTLGQILGTSAKITRYIAMMNTQLNPMFGPINFIRDVGTAMLNLSSTLIAGKQKEIMDYILPALKAIYTETRARNKGVASSTDPMTQAWLDFRKHGGPTGYRDLFTTSKDRTDAIRRELGRLRNEDIWGKASNVKKTIVDWLSDYNGAMENATRLSAYRVALDSGMSKEKAIVLAKSLTVDFNRKGQIATQAGALYAFFNASAQGSARMVETLLGPAGRKVMMGGIILGTVQALTMAAAGFEENDPPEFVRERNIIIPTGGKSYVTIPMPLGFHIIPNIGRITSEWAMGGFKQPMSRFADLFGTIAESFNPMGSSGFSLQTITPTVIDPFAALSENKDWTGKQISRPNFSSLAPTPGFTRTRDTATWFSKQLSWALNRLTGGTEYKPGFFSPTADQIDFLQGQFTGGIGREANKLLKTGQNLYSGEDIPPYQIPGVGRFYGNTESQASQSTAFYNNLKVLNQHEMEIKGRQKNREPISDYLKDNPEARFWMMGNKVESSVSRLMKQKQAMEKRGVSRESIKSIDNAIAAQMKRFNETIKRATG